MLDQFASLVIYNNGAIDRILQQAVKDFGLRWSALRVLADLVHAGPLTQKDIVEIEQLRQATVSVLLQEMLEEDLIGFKKNPKDGRSRLVVITKKGKTVYKRCGECIRPVILQVFGSLNAKELETVIAGESLMKRSIDSYDRER
jgi:DNA-binding MarR family transcriptional regulator